MNFADYTAFRVAVRTLIEGDDASQFTFSASTVDLLIGLGEDRVYRELRASTMVQAMSATVTDNAAPLPADLLELKEVRFSGEPPLDIVPLDRLRRLIDASTGGTPRYAAQDGDTLVFWPAASGTALGSYYAKHAPLASGDWAEQTTFARYPGLFLFAALVESSPVIGEDARIPVWEGKYQQALAHAQQDERMRVYGGGPLRVRTR